MSLLSSFCGSLFRENDVNLARLVIYDHHVENSVTIQVAYSNVREARRERERKDAGTGWELPKCVIQGNLQNPSIKVGHNSIEFATCRKLCGEHCYAVSRNSLEIVAVNRFKAV